MPTRCHRTLLADLIEPRSGASAAPTRASDRKMRPVDDYDDGETISLNSGVLT